MAEELDVAAYLAGNFGILPPEVVMRMMTFLSPQDLANLCGTDIRFDDFCRQFRLREDRAFQELQRVAPLSAVVTSPGEVLQLVRRGMETVYNVTFERGYREVVDVSLGTPRTGGLQEGTARMLFSITGLPPAPGTTVWLFGLSAGNRPEQQSSLQTAIYLDVESAIEDTSMATGWPMDWFADCVSDAMVDDGVMVGGQSFAQREAGNPEMYEGEEGFGLAVRQVFELELVPNNVWDSGQDSWFLHRIRLP